MGRSTTRGRARRVALTATLLAGLLVPALAVSAAGAQTEPPAGGTRDRRLSSTLAALAASPLAEAGATPPGAAGADAVESEAASLNLPPAGTAGSLMVRDGGRVLVTIHVDDTDQATVDAVGAAGAVVTFTSAEYRRLTAEVAPAQLEALLAVPGVRAIEEVPTPMTSRNMEPRTEPAEVPPVSNVVNCATNPTGIKSEGDAQLSADAARSASAVDGDGVKVGVLSDSFNTGSSLTSAAVDVGNAELPGTGNPCGHTTPVQVLGTQPVGADEGRAMAQIVHDLAPYSPLAFASAFNGQDDFANEIRALQGNGAKVIVDDVSYFTEPFYQDGPVAKAVNDVTAAGATYFSSAGNSTPQNVASGGSYEAMSYRGTATCPTTVANFDGYDNCHDFDGSAGGVSNHNQMTIPGGTTFRTTLGWSQPMFGVTTDLDYFLLDAATGSILAAANSANAGTGSPTEFLQWSNAGATRNVWLVIARWSGGDSGSPRLKAIVHRNPATAVQWNASTVAGGDVAGPTVFGHNATLTNASIAAIPWDNANTIEPFSSRGPTTYCWQPVNGGSPSAAMPCTTKNLDVAATDGVSNSFFGSASPPFRFYGTSAAAPHAAAIAALQVEKQPCRTPAQYIAAQRASGQTFGSFTVNDFGSGRVTATTAITNLTPCPGSGFHPLSPSRILDSRTANGGWGSTPLPAGVTRDLQVTGRSPSNIPASARAVVMNVTVTGSSDASFLRVWPSGSGSPNVSNLNFSAGQTIPNLVTVKLGAGGKVSISSAVGSVHVIADVVGYFDDGTGAGDRFNGINPTRLLDSRGSNGGFNSQPLAAGTSKDLAVRQPGRAEGVPATATAIIANVTVTGSTAESFLRVWPSGETEPTVSNLNFGAGQTIPNLVMIKIGTNGKVSLSTAAGSTHVVVDVVGYFDPGTGSRFYPVEPRRVLDSRFGTGLNGAWSSNTIRQLSVAGAPGTKVPSGANGIIANFTVTDGTAESLITVYPQGVTRPNASNLNFGAGQVIPNLVAVGLPVSGQVSIFNDQGQVNVIADVVGYFKP